MLASEDFVRKHKLEAKAVEILGMAMATDMPSTFDEKSMIKLVGFDLTKKAAEKGIKEVSFDRGHYRYHGRIKALADSARQGGLIF